MKFKNVKFDWNDILIEPSLISTVVSRQDLDIFYEDNMLPLFTAPMDTVIDESNYNKFIENGINAILPRTVKLTDSMYENNSSKLWFSYGLTEFEELFLNTSYIKDRMIDYKLDKVYALIDIANGHQKNLHDIVKRSKKEYKDKLVLMVGNVANPETYRLLSMMGADMVRLGIGNGNGCHFTGTKILTDNGYKNIEDICVGDNVLTHLRNFKKVELIHILKSDDNYKLNDNKVTGNHEYYVINKKYKDIITDDNIHEYAEWIRVDKLNKDFLLTDKDFKLIEIDVLEKIQDNETVYDLTVKDDHSYTANNIIVHNCLTTEQLGIGYPLGSLIKECYEISCELDTPSKIVADGGFKGYSDIIKSLAVGSDYVMLGSIFNKSLESCGDTYLANEDHGGWKTPGSMVDQYSEDTKHNFEHGTKYYKMFRGMSTKEAQKAMGKTDLKTSEGIVKLNPVEYTLSGWVDNFRSYLKSAMSYTGKTDIKKFIGQVRYNFITQFSYNRFHK